MTTFGDSPLQNHDLLIQPISSAVAPAFLGRPAALLDEARRAKGHHGQHTFDGVYDQWLAAAHRTIKQAALAALHAPTSATAASRLAQAELAAGDHENAAQSATRALDLAATNKASGPVDAPAMFSAIQVLLRLDMPDLANSWLRQIPAHPVLKVLAASLMADSGDFEAALELLGDLRGADAESLRGYLYLRLDKPQRAINHLRKAYNSGDPDPDVCLNLARAFWMTGSARKATNFAQQSVRLTPSRKDASLTLLNILISLGRIKAAESEIAKILEGTTVEPPEITLARAQIANLQGDLKRSLSLLKRAEEIALRNDETLAQEIKASVALLRYKLGEIRNDQALRKVRESEEKVPYSVQLLMTHSELAYRKSQAADLAAHYSRVKPHTDVGNLRSVDVQISYLRGDFEEASEKCRQWVIAEPLNPFAAGIELYLSSYVTQNWAAAAQKALHSIRRLGDHHPFLSNNAAFVLCLAGEGQQAERVLAGIPDKLARTDYVIQATSGLIAIAQGQIQQGMRCYRRAAELADQGPTDYIDRPRMAIYQGLALWVLGITTSDIDTAVRAASLPHVDLPSDWEDLAEFQFLRWACAKVGCPWPPMLG